MQLEKHVSPKVPLAPKPPLGANVVAILAFGLVGEHLGVTGFLVQGNLVTQGAGTMLPRAGRRAQPPT